MLFSKVFRPSLASSATRRAFSAKPQITAAMVKELREKSGAGMMDCKKALGDAEVNGDFAKAMDWLRAKGIARATSSATRAASEGVIAAFTKTSDASVTLLEVNSETDFVSRNADFHTLARNLVVTTAGVGNAAAGGTSPVPVPDLLALPAASGGSQKSVGDLLIDAISTIRENITVRRAVRCFPVPAGTTLGVYVHGKVCDDVVIEGAEGGTLQIGTQAAVVALTSSTASDTIATAARKLAMHTVAASPLYLTAAEVPADVVERERAIFRDQAETANAANAKPKAPEMLERIVAGKLAKRLNEVALLGQNHMAEADGPLVEKHVKALGAEVARFTRWQLGGAGSGACGALEAEAEAVQPPSA